MTMQIDRRSLMKLGALGIGAMSIPAAAQILAARGFTHSVASGEPGPDSILLWTRYVPAGRSNARLHYDVATDSDFRHIVGEGSITAEAMHDFCVKPVVSSLRPATTYYYRFQDAAGTRSPVGRTRTLPAGAVDRFRVGVFSCSNLPFGYFNAYGHAAARDDIDLMMHVGDYLYEYDRGHYPTAVEAVAGRVIDPASEIIHLADYRLRYASYRVDPDLQDLHRRFPMVAMWDDHESANDSWKGGAENHDPTIEGPWSARKAAAMRAYREWMPVSDAAWTSYELGELATLFKIETRLTARDHQLSLGAALNGVAPGDLPAALVAFRDHQWMDPARTLMGVEQERWLFDGFRRSVAAGKKWQVLGNQVLMGSLHQPHALAGLAAAMPEARRRDILVGDAAAQAGLPVSMDMWDGYPAARARLLQAAIGAHANLVVLTGDSHNAWGFDLDHQGTPAGIEFGGTSVTSPGYEAELPGVPTPMLEQAVVGSSPQLKWTDLSQRGYLTVELTPQRVTGEFVFMNTIRERSQAVSGRKVITVANGSNRLTLN